MLADNTVQGVEILPALRFRRFISGSLALASLNHTCRDRVAINLIPGAEIRGAGALRLAGRAGTGYLKSISTGDFGEALAALLGPEAAVLSATLA